jgi:ribosomal protein S18 acetylase RimI-like enzyme
LVLPISYPSSFFQQLLVLSSRICLVAYCASNPVHPVAFISASVKWTRNNDADKFRAPETVMSVRTGLDQPFIEILTLGVLPAYQQRGLARHLIHRVYHYFRNSSNPARHLDTGALIYANVATSNMSALSFYERMGMRISSDIIRNMYRSSGCKDGYLVVGSLATQ